jgi:methionyl-tRNA formyltransferase
MVSVNADDIIGCVCPPFDGWWHDNLETTATRLGIPIMSYEELFGSQPDIIFSINYWKTIPASDIQKVPLGIVNIHHSYLLKYRGRYSTSLAILNARRLNCWEHGTTLHYINEKLDEGDIIDSARCPIFETDTAETLFERVENLAIELFKRNYIRIMEGKVTAFMKPDSDSYFYGKEANRNLEVIYGTPLEEVYDFVRAWQFKDRPKPWIEVKLSNNQTVKLLLSVESSCEDLLYTMRGTVL